METSTSQLSRRSVVKGAAWSVPVIAVAVATPLAAASGAAGVQELDFFLTAGQVIGGGRSGSFRSNGVRLTSPNGQIIPAGVTVAFTIGYTGSLPVDFRNPQYGLAYNQGLCQGWNVAVEERRLVLTATSVVAASEVTFPSAQWFLNLMRPEDGSVVFTGVAVIPAGGDYPRGGTLTSLKVDPNGGTGELSGPTQESWPLG